MDKVLGDAVLNLHLLYFGLVDERAVEAEDPLSGLPLVRRTAADPQTLLLTGSANCRNSLFALR